MTKRHAGICQIESFARSMYDVYKKEKKKGHRERKKKKKNGTLWPTNVNSHDVKVLFYGYRVHRVKKKEDRRYVEN